jgi:hypothetical protein
MGRTCLDPATFTALIAAVAPNGMAWLGSDLTHHV